jgi:hypothetical protein
VSPTDDRDRKAIPAVCCQRLEIEAQETEQLLVEITPLCKPFHVEGREHLRSVGIDQQEEGRDVRGGSVCVVRIHFSDVRVELVMRHVDANRQSRMQLLSPLEEPLLSVWTFAHG